MSKILQATLLLVFFLIGIFISIGRREKQDSSPKRIYVADRVLLFMTTVVLFLYFKKEILARAEIEIVYIMEAVVGGCGDILVAFIRNSEKRIARLSLLDITVVSKILNKKESKKHDSTQG